MQGDPAQAGGGPGVVSVRRQVFRAKRGLPVFPEHEIVITVPLRSKWARSSWPRAWGIGTARRAASNAEASTGVAIRVRRLRLCGIDSPTVGFALTGRARPRVG